MTTPTDADREAARAMLIDLCAPMVESVEDDAAKHFAAHRLLGQRQGIEAAMKDCNPKEWAQLTPAQREQCIRNLAPDAVGQ